MRKVIGYYANGPLGISACLFPKFWPFDRAFLVIEFTNACFPSLSLRLDIC